MGYERIGGVDGGMLVPDLAVSLPNIIDGGRTDEFELRPGIAYSNGEVVAASDFLRGIERGFRFGPLPTTHFFSGLVGGGACSKSPESCDLSEGIVTDDQSRTITFHLVEPDPDFPSSWLCRTRSRCRHRRPTKSRSARESRDRAVHARRPMTDDGSVLVRNEQFRQWSVAAQPDGNVDRIERSFGGTSEDRIDVIVTGEADYLIQLEREPTRRPPRAVRRSGLRASASGNRHSRLNMALPPFNDVDVREL